MQTDSEQTDFAFDGEMTATEVCTQRKTIIIKACRKYRIKRKSKEVPGNYRSGNH